VRPYFRGSFSLDKGKHWSQKMEGDELPIFLVLVFLLPPYLDNHPGIEGQEHLKNNFNS
jgi:hypothetical protein